MLIDLLTPARTGAVLTAGAAPVGGDQPTEKLVDDIRAALDGEARLPLRVLEELAAAATGRSELPRLSPQEIDLLRMLADGVPAPEIARRLDRNERTVYRRADDLYHHLGCTTRSQAIAKAQELGIL